MTGRPLRCLAPRPSARARLLLLPHAGGGSGAFRGWAPLLSDDLEPWALELPGHPGRLNEPLPESLDAVVDEAVRALRELPAAPIAIYGHSMGAWLGLDLAAALTRAGSPPFALVVGARGGPQAGHSDVATITQLDDDAFAREVAQRYGGIPAEVAASAEIMELFLPMLRADIALLERYRRRPAGRLDCPILCLTGDQDPTAPPPDAIQAWALETTGRFESREIEGGHFFLTACREATVWAVQTFVIRSF